MRDFRNIDRYGLNNDNDENIDENNLNEGKKNLNTNKRKAPIHPDEELKDEGMFQAMDDDELFKKTGHGNRKGSSA